MKIYAVCDDGDFYVVVYHDYFSSLKKARAYIHEGWPKLTQSKTDPLDYDGDSIYIEEIEVK